MAGLGAAATTTMAACGQQNPNSHKGIYKVLGDPAIAEDAILATTCMDCAYACGLLVHKKGDRIVGVERNPHHPLFTLTGCSEQKLSQMANLRPDRLSQPAHQRQRGAGVFSPLDWSTSKKIIQDIFKKYEPGEIAFLTGRTPDHMVDFFNLASHALGGANLLRVYPQANQQGWVNLMDASQKLFGLAKIPYFDTHHAQVIFSFGSNFGEPWMRPASMNSRRPHSKEAYWVQFTSGQTLDGSLADENIAIHPGSEMALAKALSLLAAKGARSDKFPLVSSLELAQAAAATGLSEKELIRLARLFFSTGSSLAIPGSAALVGSSGYSTALAILALNLPDRSWGALSGLFFTPGSPVYPQLVNRPSSEDEIEYLIDRMHNHQIKALFIHGLNPLTELPAGFGFVEALGAVETVVSLAAFPDETLLHSDYVFPGRTAFESWGYQKSPAFCDRVVVSALQPVTEPVYPIPSTLNLFLSALRGIGGSVAAALPFEDEKDFMLAALSPLVGRKGNYRAADHQELWSRWRQNGGWWSAKAELLPAVSIA